MKIIGVGCGPGMITEEGIRVLQSAKQVYGSLRAIELAAAYISDADVHEITDYKSLKTLPESAVVLSTGDPLMAGLGYLPGEVISGISSLQAAYAKLHIPWTNAAVVNAHGKNHAEAVLKAAADIKNGHSVFLIADPEFSVEALASVLSPETKIAVCSDLGYDTESVIVGTAEHPPKPASRLFCVVCGY